MRSPDASVVVDWPPESPHGSGRALCFFKDGRHWQWSVRDERLVEGFPRPLEADWPGLAEALAGRSLRGALSGPALGPRVLFFPEDAEVALEWDLATGRLAPEGPRVDTLFPGGFASRADFTPVYVELPDRGPTLLALRGREYAQWSVSEGGATAAIPGFPRTIASDFIDGMMLSPRSAVAVDWPERSAALANHKMYFFMGDLYLRWDLRSGTKNYRTDILAGWPGWPG
jgi:hypothetical protein